MWIGPQTLISSSSSVSIGSSVDVGPQVYIGTGTHEIDATGAHSAGKGENRDIGIGAGVWLGARCMILPGVSVSEKAVVAAGAVVTKNVAGRCLVAGVPAAVMRDIGAGEAPDAYAQEAYSGSKG